MDRMGLMSRMGEPGLWEIFGLLPIRLIRLIGLINAISPMGKMNPIRTAIQAVR